VTLAVNTSAEVQKKNVQYETGMSLLSGKYHLKFVVRENQTGRMDRSKPILMCPI